MPLDAPDQKNAVRFIGVLVHERLNALRCPAERLNLERAEDRHAHCGFMNAVVGEDIRLSFGGICSVTAHRGEQERVRATVFPEIDDCFNYAAYVRNAAATYADRNAGTLRHFRNKVGLRELLTDMVRQVRNRAVGKTLLSVDESGQIHLYSLLFTQEELI